MIVVHSYPPPPPPQVKKSILPFKYFKFTHHFPRPKIKDYFVILSFDIL